MKDLREHTEPTFGLPEILKTAGHVAGAGVAATVGGVVAVTTSGCCGGGSSSSSSDDFNYEAWAETDGAAGRINMQAVQQAFETATDPSNFEDRVNQIYEGEHPILVRVYNSGQQQFVEGWEDLDDDGTINQTTDDKLFTLTRGQNGQATLEGHGANSYYRHQYPPTYNPMGGFWTGFLVANMMRPGWGGYYTSPARRTVIVNNTRAYRASPAYAATRNANRAFYSAQRASNPRFATARSNVSPARSSFRSSVRSSGGSFRSSGGFGRSSSSFRGGGR